MRERPPTRRSKLNKALRLYLRRAQHADPRSIAQYGIVLLLILGLLYHFTLSSSSSPSRHRQSLHPANDDGPHRVDPFGSVGKPWLKRNDGRSPGDSSRMYNDNNKGVSVWHFPPCRGTFHSQPAEHSDIGFPYAIIRDATVDRRPVTTNVLRGCHHPTAARFTLYLSVHYSVHISKRHMAAVITSPLYASRLNLSLHFVLHATQFLLRGPYRPGKRTFFGHHATEWHVGMCLRPRRRKQPMNGDGDDGDMDDDSDESMEAEQLLTDAVDDDVRFNLTVRARRFDGVDVPLQFDMSLGCVQGWQTPGLDIVSGDGMPRTRSLNRQQQQQQPMQQPLLLTNRQLGSVFGLCDGNDTASARFGGVSGAVLLSGSSLYGHKKRDVKYFREIAHFALRALHGPVRYDAVVMSVVSDATVSDAALRCASLTEGDEDDLCRERVRLANNELLDRIAGEIGRELALLGAPRETARKVILVPSCTLGSDAERSEFGDACNQTKHYGQYWATVFAYAPVAPFFRWAASNDMDEFIMPHDVAAKVSDVSSAGDGGVQWKHADDVLEDANERTEGDPHQGSFVAQWLNFLVESQAQARTLSTTVASGRVPILSNRSDGARTAAPAKACYDWLNDDTGKSTLRCNVGYGFTVHSSIFVFRNPAGRVNFTLGWRVNRDLRTWHGRFDYSKGSCVYRGLGNQVT